MPFGRPGGRKKGWGWWGFPWLWAVLLWPAVSFPQEKEPFLFERAKQVADAWLDQGTLWSKAALVRIKAQIAGEQDPDLRRQRLLLAVRMARWLGEEAESDRLLVQLEEEAGDDPLWRFAVDLERALEPSFDYHLEEAEKRLAALLARTHVESLPVPARVWLRLAQAHLDAFTNRPQEAIRSLAQAAAEIRDAPAHLRQILMATLLLGYGEVSASFLDLKGVVRSYDAAFRLRKALPGPANTAEIVYHIGNLLNRSGQSEAARLLFGRLVALGRAQGSPPSVFFGEYGLMKVWHNLGDPDRSDQHARAALAAFTPRPLYLAAIAQHRALNALTRGDRENARKWFAEGEKLMKAVPRTYFRSEYASYQALIAAELAAASGQGEEAIAAMRQYARIRLEAIREIFRREAAFVLSSLLNELEEAEVLAAQGRQGASRHLHRLGLARQLAAGLGVVLVILLLLFLYQRNTAKALARARLEAERASRRKDEFLAAMSHELRTPLNAIIGFAEWTLQEPHGSLADDRYRQHFQAIASSGRHLLAVINDLIEASEQAAGPPKLVETTRPLADDVMTVVRLLEPEARDRRKIIQVEVPENLPHLRADHRLVRQILINLLGNAIKYADEDTTIRLTAHAAADGGIEIVVADEGPGMSEEELAEARTRFGRPRSHWSGPADDASGSGLGLAIVDELVRAHDGSWEIVSRLGEGTRVVVHFPPERSEGMA